MFGTWKYDPETDEVQSIRNAFDPVTARSSSHQACDRCHEKKLRCSGDKAGCDRCRSNNLRCEYTRSGSKSSRKGKKSSSRKSSEDDAGPSSSSSRRGGSSSKRYSGGRSSRAVTAAPEEQGVLSQFDFSSLNPEDGFDFSAGLDPYTGMPVSTNGGYAVPVTSAAASQGYMHAQTQMQMQMQVQGDAQADHQQSWEEYQQYAAAYGQQGYPPGDWSQYGGGYSHQ